MTQENIKEMYDSVLSLIAQYESETNTSTIDGLTSWLLRKKALELSGYRKYLKENILQSCKKQKKVSK